MTVRGSITEDNVTIRCFNGTVHGYEDLRSSFANSCNASFANIGLSLDVDGYRETAESLLFNKKLPSVMDYTKSSFVLDAKSGSAEIMMTAMGQGKTNGKSVSYGADHGDDCKRRYIDATLLCR